jgi:ElaB/YqjD/DUF883 family membrane-anchored ribosome-binding protein
MSTRTDAIAGVGSNNDSTTTRKVAKAAHDAIDSTASKAENIEHELRERAAHAGEKMGASQEAVARQFESTVSEVETFVRKRPVAAAGIAFAAGVLATAILRR